MKIYMRVCDRNNGTIKTSARIVRNTFKKESEEVDLMYTKELTAVDRTQQIGVAIDTFERIEISNGAVFVTDPFGQLTLQATLEYSYALKRLGSENVFLVRPPYMWEKGTGIAENNLTNKEE